MIGAIQNGDIVEKNARKRIYDRDEDDDVSDGDLDDEVTHPHPHLPFIDGKRVQQTIPFKKAFLRRCQRQKERTWKKR